MIKSIVQNGKHLITALGLGCFRLKTHKFGFIFLVHKREIKRVRVMNSESLIS